MVDEKDKNMNTEPGTIEDVMRERTRIDKLIQEKFRKKMAILFSDICGFTNFTEKRGDIASRSWVQQHHDIVLPIIESHGGSILQIMGDGVLAAFQDTLSAVQGAMAIQKALAEYNDKTDPADEIHVSMGINAGEVLLDGKNVAGDVVNTAARIESEADKDQILISKSAYEDVGCSEDVLCRAHGAFFVKGKSDSLELYRVVWQDEDILFKGEARVRTLSTTGKAKVRSPLKTLQVDVTREEDRIKISVSEQTAGEVSTVRHYEELPVSMDLIGTRCNEIIKILNNANREGSLTRDVLVRLREIGQVFNDELFTHTVKKKISETEANHLIINLDDQLVHVPWELLHDGKHFLCQRFNMGRLVRTRQALLGEKARVLARPLKMLLLADPKGDLKGAYEEGKQIRDYMDQDKEIINATLRSEGVGGDFIKEKIRNFDMVHFAGHGEFNAENPGEGGWQLTDGLLKAKEILKMAGTGAMPALIFSNACQSARTEEWGINENFHDEIFGLANAFILSGVKHYMGTFWEILDEPSRLFAMEFYKQVLAGVTIGEATRLARMELINKYGEETIVWASYILYGDPTFNYMDQIRKVDYVEDETEEVIEAVDASHDIRAREDKVQFGEKEEKKSRKGWMWVAGCAIVITLFVLGYLGFFEKDTSEFEQSAHNAYLAGDYTKARETCSMLIEEYPDLRISYLILGNVHLMEGDLSTAESFYKKSISASKGTDTQTSQALMGLGRIASIMGNNAEAMEYYKKSSEIAPETVQPYVNQAVMLDRLGDYENSLKLFEKAGETSQIDPGYMAMVKETRKKAALKNDREKQEEVDALVKELLETMKNPKSPVSEDKWTSFPLTMWLMDPETVGYSLQEGKEQIISSSIIDKLINRSRVSIVERSLLDKLLEELKLGTSALADQSTALSLGRIMAARFILPIKVIYAAPETQISMRMIETETGTVRGAINETFENSVSASNIAEKISILISEKINEIYPLRGKVKVIEEDNIVINIGQNIGVKTGQNYWVKEGGSDTILEIIGVEPEESTAKIKQGSGDVEAGMKVEFIEM